MLNDNKITIVIVMMSAKQSVNLVLLDTNGKMG